MHEQENHNRRSSGTLRGEVLRGGALVLEGGLKWERTNLAVTPKFALVQRFLTNPELNAGSPKKQARSSIRANPATLTNGSLNKNETRCPTPVGTMKLNTNWLMEEAPPRHGVSTNDEPSNVIIHDSTRAAVARADLQKAAAGAVTVHDWRLKPWPWL